MRALGILLLLFSAVAALADEGVIPSGPTPTPGAVPARWVEIERHAETNSNRTSARWYTTWASVDANGNCLRDAAGSCIERKFTFEAGDATAIINQLDKGNFTTVSQTKAIGQKLIAAGLLTGAVSGTPGVPALPTPQPTPTP